MPFPTKISEPFFQTGKALQPGWGEVALGESGVSISGRGPSGCASTLLFGALVASAVAAKKTFTIAYGDIVNVSASGKKLTIEYRGEKGKTKRMFLVPFREKGFFGGKDPQARQLAEQIEERCAG